MQKQETAIAIIVIVIIIQRIFYVGLISNLKNILQNHQVHMMGLDCILSHPSKVITDCNDLVCWSWKKVLKQSVTVIHLGYVKEHSLS